MSNSSGSRTSSVASLNSYSSSQTVYEINNKKGVLKKKGFWSHWKECWFVLEGTLLLEYKTEHSSKPSKVLNIDKYVVKLAENVTGAPFSFALMSTTAKDPIFLLASNESEQVEWVSALASRTTESTVDWGTDHVLEAFNDAVIQSSERGIITGVNETALKLFGYKKSDLIGKPLTIIMPPEYKQVHDTYLQKYLESGTKNLIGKPRKLTAVSSNGNHFSVLLSLGEVFSGGIRKYIATMRPEVNKFRSQESIKTLFDEIIDKSLKSAASDIKSALVNEIQSLYTELENVKTRNLRSDNLHEESQKKDLKIQINTSNIQINERLADMGGSGAIVSACTVDGFSCVMKELNIKGVDKITMESFMSEVTLLESLPYHKNLARYLFHAISDNKLRLFTTRYAMNLTQSLIQREDRYFLFEEIIKFSLDIVRGLEVLHEYNIIHRDLKSDNIFVMLNQSGSVDSLVIGDFDTAKKISEGIVAKTTIGTPGYMAPEILRSRNTNEYGFAADIWSLGMLMYEMMTLKRPFSDRNVFALTELTLQGATPILTEQLKNTYKLLLPLWNQCLSIEPKERPTIIECKQSLLKLFP